MGEKRNIWIVGGDLRLGRLADLLARDGHTVSACALEGCRLSPEVARRRDLAGLREADCVVLPVPVLGEGDCIHTPLGAERVPLEEVLAAAGPEQLLCGGMVSPLAAGLAAGRGMTIRDYFAREELAVANAAITAEGAVQIALEELEVTLRGAQVLILGFGRVGKLTARAFDSLGARVTVAARKGEDLAWAAALGYTGVPLEALAGCLGQADLVVNTVPAVVLTRDRLAALKKGCPVIDLASRPGGVERSGGEETGVRLVWALGLPGKTAPTAAAAAIRDALYSLLREYG